MDKSINKKNIFLTILVIIVGLAISAGTYAYLTVSVAVTNGNYNTMTHCFNIDYNINNTDGSQNMTGNLFPTFTPNKGLTGRVGFKINNSCQLTGAGTLKLHIDDTFTVTENGETVTKNTSTKFGVAATSYCKNIKDFEVMSEYTTKSTCEENNGMWVEIPTTYCENIATLEILEEYDNETDCTSNDGKWVTGGSPLKYAVYDSTDTTAVPVKVGYIYSSDIGKDAVLYDNFEITSTQKYYYIYIWLDGHLTDDTYTELPFSGYISAEAVQSRIN